MIDALLEKNLLPDWLIRIGIRRLLGQLVAFHHRVQRNKPGAKNLAQ